ncbi:surface protein [Flagellimonas taeanensis]|uniref:Surface protein n=1 Tax=Flagellimonas taeanensis TaxID=1005926 RepID=A0A1M6ZIR5_9FLAO|nr:BspA family leucine-rich repeat surface protein [Allomuricauda taeanensis]SFC31122.1 surface protein [Allomuricauda taeanensis]SHL30398.1 surface protein [Allomuricauda taeanensis]
MKNVMKSFGAMIVVSVLIWSCGKDDGPTPPKNTAPTIKAQEFTVDEDIADTEIIGTVQANDPERDAIEFSIKTNDNNLFEITKAGDLSLATGKALDFETAAQHVITVQVGDGDKTATATVTIKVGDVDESLAADPGSFITTWRTTVANEEIVIATDNSLIYDYAIDWGDGTEENIASGTSPTHIYASAGTYTVAIKGVFPRINMIIEDGYALKLMSIEQWGSNSWESMNGAFGYCANMVYNATDVPDLSKVTDMSNMFYESATFNGEIGNWNTSIATHMEGVFFGATAFNGDIGNWDVSNVTTMSTMFYGATSFDQPLGDWDVSNVTTMFSMFRDAAAFNQNLGGWDLSSITSLSNMFDNSGLDALNYSNILKGWGGQGNVFIPDGITLGAAGVKFCNDADTTYFHDTVLVIQNGWTINDEGSVACQ